MSKVSGDGESTPKNPPVFRAFESEEGVFLPIPFHLVEIEGELVPVAFAQDIGMFFYKISDPRKAADNINRVAAKHPDLFENKGLRVDAYRASTDGKRYKSWAYTKQGVMALGMKVRSERGVRFVLWASDVMASILDGSLLQSVKARLDNLEQKFSILVEQNKALHAMTTQIGNLASAVERLDRENKVLWDRFVNKRGRPNKKTTATHVLFVKTEFNGRCPICKTSEVVDGSGRKCGDLATMGGISVCDTWLVCSECRKAYQHDEENKKDARIYFDAYQARLKRFGKKPRNRSSMGRNRVFEFLD